MKNGKWYEGWRDFCFNSPYNYDYIWAIKEYVTQNTGYPYPGEPLKHYLDTETHLDVLLEILKTANWTNK